MRLMMRCFLTLLLLTGLLACHPEKQASGELLVEKKGAAMPQEVSIKLGELGPAFAKRVGSQVRVIHQPAGLDFYKVEWNERPRGVVRFQHGRYSFVIEDVLGVSTSQDLGALKDEGFHDFAIFAGITDPDRIPHDEARIKTHQILRRIMDAGWRQVIERSEPRLNGKARQDYMFATTNLNGLDAAYVPTFADWMRIESHTPWSFYADGVFLSIDFTREPTLTDPAKSGSYLLTFDIKSATEYFRGYAGPDNRLRWKELLPAELAKVAKLRAEKEAALKAKGVPIDESYQDPPPPAL